MIDRKTQIKELLESAGATIKFKNESSLMKFIGFFASIFNKNFMTSVATVFNTTIWFPDRNKWELYLNNHADSTLLWVVHECAHVKSYKSKGFFKFWFLYLFPQSLFIVGIPSIVACIVACFAYAPLWAGFLVAALSLLLLLPLPAPWRVKEEVEAEVQAVLFGRDESIKKDPTALIQNVCSLNYYNPLFSLNKALDMYLAAEKKYKK